MKRVLAPWWGDLATVVGLALAGLVLALVPVPDPLRTAALLPLLLIVPGYAVAAALFLPGEISRELRGVLTVAFSLCASAFGGLVTELVIGLDRPVWATLLTFVTVLAAWAAVRRRDSMPAGSGGPGPTMPRVGLVSLVAILSALAVAGWAIADATDGVHRQLNESHFTSLRLVPEGAARTVPGVALGVLNHEGRAVGYRLTLRRGPTMLREWRFRLDASQAWQAQLEPWTILGDGPLVGRLYRGGRRYHRVTLHLGGGS